MTGGSLGGMQALSWAVAYPNDVRAIIPIATTAQLGAQGLAWNAIARNAIMADPDWQGGRYYGTGRTPRRGHRHRAHGRPRHLPVGGVDAGESSTVACSPGIGYSFDVTGADFAVESYLRHQAATFAARFDANSYLYLSRALTYFDLARDYGQGSLERALAGVRARSLLISFSSDWLYPPADSAEIAEALRAGGAEVESCLLETSYGHDSFLLEEARQTPIIADVPGPLPVGLLAGGRRLASHAGRSRLRLRHPRHPRRSAPGPVHGRARRADLSDHQLRLRGPGLGRRLLQPAGVRQHLLPHHEPDRRHLRGARRQPGGRRPAASPSPVGWRRRRRRSSPCSSRATTSSPRRRSTAARSPSSSTCSASFRSG